MRLTLGCRKAGRAAVLGCGPAGLFAAHALVQNGWSVTIFSKRRKSHMFGAQYLHSPIPGLTDGTDPVTVEYQLRGTSEGYREKVYGPNPVMTSVETLGETHMAWDIRRAYDKAYHLYEGLIQEQTVTPEFLGMSQWSPDVQAIAPRNLMQWSHFEVVVNSIPMKSLCYQPDLHQFHSTSIWAIGDAPERGISVPFGPGDNTVLCDGTKDTGWYRSSNVFGFGTVEWPSQSKPPISYVAAVEKPIYTDCTCYRMERMGYRFMPVGRYGQWSKGVLSHHAYTQAAQL